MYFKTIFPILFFGLLVCTSCNRSLTGIKGEGPVTEKTYELNDDFNILRAKQAWEVNLIKTDRPKVVIRTQENIHPYITPEVKNGKLVIGFTKSETFGNIKTMEADVYYTSLRKIKASSASTITGKDLIEEKELHLSASSAATIRLDQLKVGKTIADASSASDLQLRGTSIDFEGNASSASDIKAKALKVKSAHLKASSGADIAIKTINHIQAKASSGATIRYSGDPAEKNISRSSGGSVKEQ